MPSEDISAPGSQLPHVYSHQCYCSQGEGITEGTEGSKKVTPQPQEQSNTKSLVATRSHKAARSNGKALCKLQPVQSDDKTLTQSRQVGHSHNTASKVPPFEPWHHLFSGHLLHSQTVALFSVPPTLSAYRAIAVSWMESTIFAPTIGITNNPPAHITWLS